jgi:hypothetical protein
MNNIKEYYTRTFPTDELGQEINPNATFLGLIGDIGNLYDYIGVADSIVRERVFERVAEIMEVPYNEIYRLWIRAEFN